ncbi:Cytochrome d ubiquinol oxidase, subunit II [Syntrophomonas zehnderi OL-4]|uniref:Cytochrome d ubiquinol oxidase, subunit II n=1 Tax=Syntrophomonas zehnderi OL-4 TaxID=690567 RepID=A0A0E4GC13_9FIRM|nr:cytochrome d ubiquinol oxidase subunit II [Syntrophomonas zehnderi]CFX01203.1 Cytochrome d ubiquinol oxidase, subunit II [Syntrophomonas zehnderi OL-4]
MDLNILWFILVGVLFCGFFFLEGFDYGVGILLPFVGKTDIERRVLINSIGPVWDGNQVWMITAGGAIFAAFPNWYATLFSGFYLALFLLLLALIIRGVSFEFRSKDDNPLWRSMWDWALWLGSLLPALLWGIAIANLIRGVPIDANMHFTGNFFSLLSPFTIMTGIAFVALFTYHGALYLTLKVEGDLLQRVKDLTPKLGVIAIITVVAMAGLLLAETDIIAKPISMITLALTAIVLIVSVLAARGGSFGRSFFATALTIVFTVITIFTGLFPRVMVSSLEPAWNLTIYNAASGFNTLKVMTVVAVILVPIVLAYQAWAYWTFRHRVSVEDLNY